MISSISNPAFGAASWRTAIAHPGKRPCCAGGRDRDPAAERARASLAAFAYSRSSDATLRITTDDGDVVTLTFHSALDARRLEYRAQRGTPEGRESLRAKLGGVSVERGLEVEVEGSLDAEERSDIRELVRRTLEALKLEARGEGTLESLAPGGDGLDSLEGYALDVTRQESLTAVWLAWRKVTGRVALPEPVAPPVEEAATA